MLCSGIDPIWDRLIFMAARSMHGANGQLRNPVVAGAMKFSTMKINSKGITFEATEATWSKLWTSYLEYRY